METDRKQWTTSELNYLKQNFGKVPRRVMAEQLGVTPMQVGKKTNRMGLKVSEVNRTNGYYHYPQSTKSKVETKPEQISRKVWSDEDIKEILWRNHTVWERRRFIETFNITSQKLDELYDEVLAEHNICVGI